MQRGERVGLSIPERRGIPGPGSSRPGRESRERRRHRVVKIAWAGIKADGSSVARHKGTGPRGKSRKRWIILERRIRRRQQPRDCEHTFVTRCELPGCVYVCLCVTVSMCVCIHIYVL